MFDVQRYYPGQTLEKSVVPGQSVAVEGAALVRIITGGTEFAKLSSGATGEDFCGVSKLDNQSITNCVVVEQWTVPGSGTLRVDFDSSTWSSAANDLRIMVNGKDTAASTLTIINGITAGAPGASKVQVDYTNGAMVFATAEANKVVTAWIRQSLSTLQSKQLFGVRNINNTASADFGMVGSMGGTPSVIYTDQFVINKLWERTNTGGLPIKTGPNGQFVPGGNGDRAGTLLKLPTVSDPWLGINLSIDSSNYVS
jgi:hypothetical protein